MGNLKINETGNQYGRLTVLSFAGMNQNRKAQWLCSCECGNMSTVLGAELRKGSTKSCGCLQKQHRQLRVRRPKMGRISLRIMEVEDFE
jgi:hypothetical protein